MSAHATRHAKSDAGTDPADARPDDETSTSPEQVDDAGSDERIIRDPHDVLDEHGDGGEDDLGAGCRLHQGATDRTCSLAVSRQSGL